MDITKLSNSKIAENVEEEEVSENEIYQILNALHINCIEKISKSDFKVGIIILKKSEQLLEAILTQGGEIQHDIVLATLHNLALCYQKSGDFPKSISYIEACIYNATTYKVMNPNLTEIHYKIKNTSYLTKTYIQCCALFSQVQEHKKALTNARKAINSATVMIKSTLRAASNYTVSVNKTKKAGKPIPTGITTIMSIISLASPTLKSLKQFLKTGTIKSLSKLPSVLGVKEFPQWVYNISLADLMFLQILEVEDLKDSIGIQTEFTKDYLLMKICIFAVSLFCASTEMQFIMVEPGEAEKLHNKAIALMGAFFPEQCPLLIYFKDCYSKRFKFTMDEIVKVT